MKARRPRRKRRTGSVLVQRALQSTCAGPTELPYPFVPMPRCFADWHIRSMLAPHCHRPAPRPLLITVCFPSAPHTAPRDSRSRMQGQAGSIVATPSDLDSPEQESRKRARAERFQASKIQTGFPSERLHFVPEQRLMLRMRLALRRMLILRILLWRTRSLKLAAQLR